MTEFTGFPKIGRFSRNCTITEKIDGTNAQIYIDLIADKFLVGSRSRWITPDNDNHGFAKWAYDHKEELIAGLGDGSHFGEWWGYGIRGGYGLKEKRFSLFNTFRWNAETTPACCNVVPVLYEGPFEEDGVLVGMNRAMNELRTTGSRASPGFMKPEGIMIYHHASKAYFKKTLLKDEAPKGMVER